MKKYDRFIIGYLNFLKENADYLRAGQALIGYLYSFDKEEADKISSACYYDRTDLDCFYKDDLIPNTLKHLEEIWKND